MEEGLIYLKYTALIGSVVIFLVFRLTWFPFTLEQNMSLLRKSQTTNESGMVFQETVRAVPGIGLTDQNLTLKIGARESLTTTGATGLKTVLKLQDMGGLGVGMITIVVIERILFVKNTSKNIG